MRFALSAEEEVSCCSSLIFCFAAQGAAEAQGDVKAGRAKAENVCAVCHGVDGLAKIPEAPNIAGQNENYLIEQLTAFKSGERKNEMMSIVSQNSIGRRHRKSGGVLFGDRVFGGQDARSVGSGEAVSDGLHPVWLTPLKLIRPVFRRPSD